MTLAALAGVGVLAAQAAATAPKVSASAAKGKDSTQPSTSSSAAAGSSTSAGANGLPAGSGSGLRVVYGVAAKRVWLISASNAVVRTMTIVPGTLAVPTGTYTVTSKLSSVTGTDGTPVQYVVLFGKIQVNGSSLAVGFDAVANVTGLPAPPTSRTAAVRMAQADAQALFNFSSAGTDVVVMP
jgi:hypothetical protein